MVTGQKRDRVAMSYLFKAPNLDACFEQVQNKRRGVALWPGGVLFFRNQAKADLRYLMNIHYAGSGESLDSLEYSCMIDAATLHSTSS